MDRKITDISLALTILSACAFFGLAQCQKSRAQKPKAAAVLAIGCVDTGGVYTPSAVSTFNAGSVAFNSAHFTRICNEVYVSGSLSGSSSYDTINSSLIQVSLPFSSDVTGQNVFGNALVGFNGNPQPTMGAIGFVHLVGATGATISWKPQIKNAYGLIYEFSYTIK
jgi:hypothetical protein